MRHAGVRPRTLTSGQRRSSSAGRGPGTRKEASMEGPRAETHVGRLLPPSAAGSRSFAIRQDPVTGQLTATGQLGVRTTHLLYDAVSELLRTDRPTWTVDVTGLDVTDHAGLRAIAGAYRRALRHERRIVLHGASPALRRALIRLRLDPHVLPVESLPRRVPTADRGAPPGTRRR